MILFERERRALEFVVKHVKRLPRGQRVVISRTVLEDIPKMDHNGCTWNPPDRVLENIMGSSFEFRYRLGPGMDDVTFERLERPLENGWRSYVAPDRKHLFTEGFDGIWRPKSPPSEECLKP